MSNVEQTDFYKVLGVPPSASQREIKLAYQEMIRIFDDPQNLTAEIPGEPTLRERIEMVQEAYDTLSDPEKRRVYDQSSRASKPGEGVESLEALREVRRKVVSEMEQALQKKKKQNSVYLEFFGFKEKPFDLTPDPKYLYLSAKHKEVLAHLVFGLQENSGFLKIIGEVGTGKTTICRSFLKELQNDFNFAYIIHPCVNALEMLQSINAEFGLPSDFSSKKELIQHLNEFLLKERREGHRVAVVIDEAQNLQPAVLEELRLLSNLETETQKLIQIVLIGQPELDNLLRRPELRQLHQRITIQWELLPLNKEETRGYIQHRLNVAGGKGKLRFERAAADAVFHHAQGIPRMINVLADRALLIAYTQNTRTISPRIIRQAVKDVGVLPHKPISRGRHLRKGLAGVAAAGLLAWAGLYFMIEFDVTTGDAGRTDLKQMIRKNPIMMQDSGELIPGPPPATRTSAGLGKPNAASPHIAADAPNPAIFDTLRVSRADKLVTYLSSMSLAESKRAAARWVLKAWNKDPERIRNLGPKWENLDTELDLAVYEMTGNLNRLTTLNYPVLLEISLPHEQGTKYLALIAIKGETGIFGSADKLEIPMSVLEELGPQKALILWKDFEDLPEVLERGFKGREAVWLQKNLRLLGFFRGLEAPFYGRKTEAAVRQFQRRFSLKDDGRFDIESKLLLYNLLNIYDTPRLVTQ